MHPALSSGIATYYLPRDLPPLAIVFRATGFAFTAAFLSFGVATAFFATEPFLPFTILSRKPTMHSPSLSNLSKC